jgi:hypothetical protein
MKVSAALAAKSVASISDTRGTVYAALGQLNDGNGGSHIEVWYGLSTPTGGANTVTLTMGAGADVSLRWFISEFGSDGTQVLEGTPRSLAQAATTTPNTGGNFTPAGDNELLYAVTEMFTGSTISVTGSWLEDFFVVAAPNTRVKGEYWIQTTATATDAGFSLGTSDDTATVLGAFKQVAPAGGALLMGQAIF